MDSVFILDPKYIRVEIIEEKYYDSKGEIDQEKIESSIAHEVTHGLLAYKKKYCQFRFVRRYSELENLSASLLATMIEDIVVNRIIHENNFQPCTQHYINMVQYEIKKARKGEDCYKKYNNSPIFKDRFMVFRYILAWGFLRYFNSGEIDKKTLHKFLKIFQKSYPKQYEEVKKIKEIILENDIFTPEGFSNTIKKCLDLWNLTNLMKLFTC